MDFLIHSLVGLHLARSSAVAGIPLGARLLLCLAASNAPDLDRFLLLPLRETLVPVGEAGLFHSLPGAALLGGILAAVARPLVEPGQRRAVALVLAAALGLHLLGDALSVERLPLFWPLSPRRFGLAWVAGSDAWLGLLLAAPLLHGLLSDLRPKPRLHLPTRRSGAVILVSLYLAVCAAAKTRVLHATWVHHQGETEIAEVQAYPLGPGPFLWTTLARTEDRLWHRSIVSVLGTITPAGVFPTGDTDPRVQIALQTAAGANFHRSARAPFLARASEVEEDGSFEVALGDLRLGDPRSDRLPWVLWMRIGPDFSPADWAIGAARIESERAPSDPR